jgi:hypothetical protein
MNQVILYWITSSLSFHGIGLFIYLLREL